jgi:C_GCAxxG_C_C family probable redox protein
MNNDGEGDILQKAYQFGYDFERRYHGCAQCVIAGVYQLFPEMTSEDIFRSANAQGGGLGLTSRGQCGAVTGAAMILSQLHGRSLGAVEDPEAKRFTAYRLGAELAKRFEKEMGSLICGDIQKSLMGRNFDLLNAEDWQEFEKAGGHETKCPHVVGTATRILVEMLLEQKAEKSK